MEKETRHARGSSRQIQRESTHRPHNRACNEPRMEGTSIRTAPRIGNARLQCQSLTCMQGRNLTLTSYGPVLLRGEAMRRRMQAGGNGEAAVERPRRPRARSTLAGVRVAA